MEFPVLTKEIRVTLRRKESFFFGFFLYLILTLIVTVLWGIVREEGSFLLNRDLASRLLFFGVLTLGMVCFCLHAGMAAARIVVVERERNNASLVRVAPLSAWRLMFQKVLTPMVVEWLFFLGILPALSLIFLLGGIAPGEFVYHLVNLAVWINTSVLIGLWLSAGAKTTAKARTKTAAYLFSLALLLPLVALLLMEANQGINTTSQNAFLSVFQQILGFLAWAMRPLIVLSPFWMSASYYIIDDPGGFPYDDMLMTVFPQCPALLSWCIHGGLWILLFLLAVRRWKSTSEEAETAAPLSNTRGLRGLLRWIRYGRAERGSFSTGWWVFYQQEDREVFKKGMVTKALFSGVFLISFVLFFVLAYRLDPASVRIFFGSILPVTCLVAMVAPFGFASSSLRREKDRGCGVFLLAAPIQPRTILFAKWVYFQGLACKVLALGLIVMVFWFVCADLVSARGGSPTIVFGDHLGYLPYVVVWIPPVVLLGILAGIGLKTGMIALRFLILGAFLLLGGGFSILAWLVQSYPKAQWVWDALGVVVADVIPVLLLASASLLGIIVRHLSPVGTERIVALNVIAGGFWLALAILDLSGVWFDKERLWIGNGTLLFEEIRFYGRFLFLPLCVAWLMWIFAATRSRSWWQRRLSDRGVTA